MSWDFKEKDAKLSDSFKSKYVVSIKGKEAVLCDGLKVLAHEKGLKRLTTDIVQFPTSENNYTCIVKAELLGVDWDPTVDKVVDVYYTAIGDANPGNCNKMVSHAFIRMAETRAISRVLKNYTNIAMVAYEELHEVVDDSAGSNEKQKNEGITPSQVKSIGTLMTMRNLTREFVAEISIKKFSKNAVRALTKTEASDLIETLLLTDSVTA